MTEIGHPWFDDLGDVWVSTIYRESSALVSDAPRYFETMAFSRSRDGILWHTATYNAGEARRRHDLAVRWFSRTAAVDVGSAA